MQSSEQTRRAMANPNQTEMAYMQTIENQKVACMSKEPNDGRKISSEALRIFVLRI